MFPESHSTYTASRYSHMPLSLAHTSHFAFLLAANFVKSSSHLVAGLPRVRSPLLGSQCKTRVDHLPSVRLATCPAHLHLRRLRSVSQSTSVPLLIWYSRAPAVRVSHSTHPSFSSTPDEPPLEEEEDDKEVDTDDDEGDDVRSCSAFSPKLLSPAWRSPPRTLLRPLAVSEQCPQAPPALRGDWETAERALHNEQALGPGLHCVR